MKSKSIISDFKKIWGTAWPTKVILAIFVVGLIMVGVYIEHRASVTKLFSVYRQISPVRDSSGEFNFTHPLLAYETPEDNFVGQFELLRGKVQSVINFRDKGVVKDVSFYFRDIETGRWTGINENATYNPASLMKVPLMIAYYKLAENDPSLLNKKITYKPNPNQLPEASPSMLRPGQNYTVQQLLEAVIINSDNGAKDALLENIDANSFGQIFSVLGIKDPNDPDGTYTISTKTYALFFRVLYNSTYLAPKYSEQALSLLSKVVYKDGITAPLPLSEVVAHKFGEYVGTDSAGSRVYELHDCGIVYYPHHPYLLCVMTRGNDMVSLQNVIQSVSSTVYDVIKNDDKNK